MSRKKILIIIGAVLTVVLAVVIVFYKLPLVKIVKEKTLENSAEKILNLDDIKADTVITVEEKELMAKNEEKLLGEFIAKGETENCGRLSEKYKTICLNNIILAKAKASLSKELCGQAAGQDFIAACYAQVENEKSKQTQAEAEKTEKDNSEKFLTSDEYKEMISFKDKNQPIPELTMVKFMGMVYDHKDPKNCYLLPASDIQECLNLLYLNLARNDDDLPGCDLIKSDYWKNICRRDIITRRAHKQLNPKLCDSLSGVERDECLKGL